MMMNDDSIKLAEELETIQSPFGKSYIEYVNLNDVLDDLNLEQGSADRWFYLHIIRFIENKISQRLKAGNVVAVPFIGTIKYEMFNSNTEDRSKDYLDYRIKQHILQHLAKTKKRVFNEYLGYANFINWEYAKMYVSSLCLFEVI